MTHPRNILIALTMLAASACGGHTDEPSHPGTSPDQPAPDEPTTPVEAVDDSSKVVVAYVTSWSTGAVDSRLMTHINYAFGHVTDNFAGVRIDNESRLRSMVQLKRINPRLNVMLSIGGWGSGRFSEMAANDRYRKAFAADCRRVIDDFGLDGIDIDWEFPTSDAAGISASPDDTYHFTLLMRDIRDAIGPGKYLTIATSVGADYINFRAIMPYINFVNVMAYDMNNPPCHNAGLYKSAMTGWICGDEGIRRHMQKGVPAEKLVLGMPFYGHGRTPYDSYVDYRNYKLADGCREQWDAEAMVPYVTDASGAFVLSFDNPRSLGIKCDYILDNGLRGAMYWDYSADDDKRTLATTVASKILIVSE